MNNVKQIVLAVHHYADAHDRRLATLEGSQAAPSKADCDSSLPQTPHAGGMIVGMGDGSVRTVRTGVAPGVFWAAVTPAGGEVATDW